MLRRYNLRNELIILVVVVWVRASLTAWRIELADYKANKEVFPTTSNLHIPNS